MIKHVIQKQILKELWNTTFRFKSLDSSNFSQKYTPTYNVVWIPQIYYPIAGDDGHFVEKRK